MGAGPAVEVAVEAGQGVTVAWVVVRVAWSEGVVAVASTSLVRPRLVSSVLMAVEGW